MSDHDEYIPNIRDTYCKHHYGMWSHECGCDIVPRERKLSIGNKAKIEKLEQEIKQLKNIQELQKSCISLYDKAFEDTGNDYSHLLRFQMAITLKDEIEQMEKINED